MQIGDFKIIDEGRAWIHASRVGSQEQVGVFTHLFGAAHHDGWHAQVGVLEFDTGWDVRCLEVSKGAPEAVYRLLHGLRMSLYDGPSSGERWAELSQARIDPEVVPPWSNLKKASQEQLDDGAGIDVDAVLAEAGGEVGTRERMLDDESRRRGYLCCVFPCSSSLPAVASYVLTRILPLTHGYVG